ncbi:PucR family transcriptional regulator [Pimelobacter sp. 30-1]|uniref:PucR family transcriptional regulator n=1 Tax=Pimelobacter sp. 30-1 TaxID=2004991 RepID=UPI001C04869A|nr:PucR family transcriptional regulator [Pimelobacter sp. 30-1]MBU2698916.1 hypothetical protein [Pimelobacter sp. 30-1]
MSTPLALTDLLELEPYRRCKPEIMCGEHLVDRPVRWVHTSELAEAVTLLKGEELLLTSGLGLVGRGIPGIRAYIAALGERRGALALELGWTFSAVPTPMLDAAREHDVPIIALHDVVPFVELAEAGQEAIMTRRLVVHPPAPTDSSARRARLLQELEAGQIGPSSLQRRLAEVGVTPADGVYCAVVVRGCRHGTAALLEELLANAEGRQDRLTSVISGDVVALVPGRNGRELGAQMLDLVDGFARPRGDGTTCRIAIAGGEAGQMTDAALRLPEARHALSLATSLGIRDRVLSAPLIAARMVLNRLAGDTLAAKLVQKELGELIRHDRRHHTSLVDTLTAYLSHGSSMQLTAQALHCSRQALYKRKESIIRLIGDVDDPQRHSNLVVALELYALQGRFFRPAGD